MDTIINNKSSKKIYKAVAKEWGITCKMSEQCRCIDCQGNYFDCEFDEVRDISMASDQNKIQYFQFFYGISYRMIIRKQMVA